MISFRVYVLKLKFLIHLEMSFVKGDRHRSIFILPHASIQLEQCYLVKTLTYLYFVFWLLCQKLGHHTCMGLCLDLQFDPNDLCVCFYANTILSCFCYHYYYYNLSCDSPINYFFNQSCQNWFGYLGYYLLTC